MVTDWFAGWEISTAMAIFVSSWPFGLAISLWVLPPIGTAYGTSPVYLAVTVLIALGMLLLSGFYTSPDVVGTAAPPKGPLDRKTVAAVIAAGLIWSLYNVGFAMIFSFGPSLLTERDWPISTAGSAISIVLWLAALSVPLGGYLADRSNRHDTHRRGGLHHVCHDVDGRTADRGGDPLDHSAGHRVRSGRWSDPETAGTRPGARNTGHRHGPVLHHLLSWDDVWKSLRRLVRGVGWERRRRIRLWGRDARCLHLDALELSPNS